MLRNFFPKMGLKGLSIGLKETCNYAKTRIQARINLLCFSFAVELGFLSLLFLSSTPKFTLGSSDFIPLTALYNLFVLLSLFTLGFRVRSLSRHHEEIIEVKKLLVNLGSGSCSNCKINAKIPSWEGFSCQDSQEKSICSKKVRQFIGSFVLEEKEPAAAAAAEEEGIDEDDIVKLRKEIAKERKHRALVELELEKERKAASSAADEAMAKIMLLQSEKGLIEREARQYREMAEEKQLYDREVIEALRWIVSKLEAERMPIEKLI